MEIRPIAYFHSPLPEKFGIPRQSGLTPTLPGKIVLEAEFRSPEALRGMEGFDYLWLIWGFSLNRNSPNKLTVRPPRLGGNRRIGVFASRSPFRPNSLGLSSVRIASVDPDRGVIEVLGADLADGTPIYDIKPYVRYADSHPEARSGFADSEEWPPLDVTFAEGLRDTLSGRLGPDGLAALCEVLGQDPRPGYQDDPGRIYGLSFSGLEIKFRVDGNVLEVTGTECTQDLNK